MDEAEALARFSGARVARMATVARDGGPHVVPATFALVDRTIYWAVDQKPKRTPSVKRLDHLRADPRIQFVADHYEEDWTRLWWVRVTGRGGVVTGQDVRRLAVQALSAKYAQYAADPPQGDVVAVEIARVAGWEATPS